MNRTARSRIVAAVGAVVLAARAGAQQPPQEPAPAPAAQVARANELLDKHAARSKDVEVLVADYVQKRTSTLTKEPLQSRGQFLFVRDPACAVFRATEPRVSTTRLTATTYEVYRPARKQLERFHLDGPELAQGLFAAVGGDVGRLRADFDVAGVADDPADKLRVQVRLVPKVKLVREQLQELVVTLHQKDGALGAVAYRDKSGDLVEIDLRGIEVNPKQAPPATLDVPKDTQVVEHTPGRKRPV